MNNKLTLLLSIFLLLPISSQATTISFTSGGTQANTSTASNCTETGSCVLGLGEDGGDIQSHSDTGTTSATSSETTYANAQASASLSGSSYLPTLKAQAIADADKGAFATAYGVQQYTYTGSTASIFDLDYNLHGSVGTGPFSEQLSATVGVLLGDSPFAWDFDVDLATNVYEIATPLDLVDIDYLFIGDGNDVNIPGTISFILNPGDIFYVFAQLTAKAVNGTADGWNTFSMSFVDDTGLAASATPDVSAVPVPAAAWLFGSALLGFVGLRRSKKA